MNVPYGCVMVATNESVRKILNPSGGYSLQTSMMAGMVAGAFAAVVTTPLDVVKTRLQTQDLVSRTISMSSSPCPPPSGVSGVKPACAGGAKRYLMTDTPSASPLINSSNPSTPSELAASPRYKSMRQTISRIAKEEGYMAFTKGIIPRILVQAPSVAISWTAYEFAKSILHPDNR
jgi:solute carrier family 25 iron transporter 28/37